jgi:hypothetical protein
MRHLWRIGALMLILIAGLVATPAQARQGQPIHVISSAARPDFPKQIVFALSAASDAAAITQVQLLYGATRNEALAIVELTPPGGTQISVEHTLDTQVYYFPPGTDMIYRWVIRDAAGNTFESEPQHFVYHDERFTWSERGVGAVTVYWYEGGEVFGDELAAAVERALAGLQSELGAGLDKPVRIYVYATSADMYSALQANSAEWIGGQANPTLGLIVATISPDDEVEVRRIIPHELSHQVLHQVVENPYGGVPFWLNEGLAVHNQEVRDPDYDQRVKQAAEENRLIPLEALASSFPADPDQARLSYAESQAIVEYILDTYGEARLQALVDAITAATPVDAAIEQVFGISVDELDEQWRQQLPQPNAPPPDLAGPQVAPDERFSEPPVLPPGVLATMAAPTPTPAQPFKDRPSALISWLDSLPAWVTVSMAALSCIVGALLLGVVLLVGLRMLGVDKRER